MRESSLHPQPVRLGVDAKDTKTWSGRAVFHSPHTTPNSAEILTAIRPSVSCSSTYGKDSPFGRFANLV